MPRRVTAQEFMKTPPRLVRGRPSLLAPYATDLATMREAGYSLSEMREFLRLNDVTVGLSTICMFFKRQEAAAEAAATAAAEAEAEAARKGDERPQPARKLKAVTNTAGAANSR